MKKLTVLAVALSLTIIGLATAFYAWPHSSAPAVPAISTQHSAHGDQIQAPPRPPMQTPVERVVVSPH